MFAQKQKMRRRNPSTESTDLDMLCHLYDVLDIESKDREVLESLGVTTLANICHFPYASLVSLTQSRKIYQTTVNEIHCFQHWHASHRPNFNEIQSLNKEKWRLLNANNYKNALKTRWPPKEKIPHVLKKRKLILSLIATIYVVCGIFLLIVDRSVFLSQIDILNVSLQTKKHFLNPDDIMSIKKNNLKNEERLLKGTETTNNAKQLINNVGIQANEKLNEKVDVKVNVKVDENVNVKVDENVYVKVDERENHDSAVITKTANNAKQLVNNVGIKVNENFNGKVIEKVDENFGEKVNENIDEKVGNQVDDGKNNDAKQKNVDIRVNERKNNDNTVVKRTISVSDKEVDTIHEDNSRVVKNTEVPVPLHMKIPSNSFPYPKVDASNPCSLTVVIFDPRLPILNTKHELWYAIESIIKNTPSGLCINIQTSSCIFLYKGPPGTEAAMAALKKIQSMSQQHPLFNEFLYSGRVRVSIIDHKKYRLKSCDNFWSPSTAWMNVHYWTDEFISHQDTDMVLFFQDDSVFCNSLDISKWADVAYVGAPWPNIHASVPKPSVCEHIDSNWKRWTGSDVELNFCKDGYDPLGNGGLSLRSRKWMERAIRACPHRVYSDLSSEELESVQCSVTEDSKMLPEDLYFSTVLRGINAPLPNAFEASLFSSEMIFPDQVAKNWYGPKDVSKQISLVAKRMSDEDVKRYEKFQRVAQTKVHDHFVPIGVHNIWYYHNPMFYRSREFTLIQCPYVSGIIPLHFLGPMARTRFEHLDKLN